MGTDSKQTYTLYFGGVPIGEISQIHDLTPDCADNEPVAFLSDPMELHIYFEATRWTKCHSRKKFIKLMAGALCIQRNDAQRLARECMASGCPSYMELWASVFAYCVKYVLSYMFTHNNPNRKEDAQ